MIIRFHAALLALAVAAQADPLAELTAFSSIKGVSLDQLAKGEVMASRIEMSFARGMGVESCYLVRKPLAKTLELHESSSSDSQVYLEGDLSAHPSAAEFAKLGTAPGNSAVKAFISDTLKVAGSGTKLQVSNAEAKSAPPDSAGVTAFWSNVLTQRAQAFASGGTGRLAPYETGGETVQAAGDIAQLLKESGKVRSQFSGIIGTTALGGGRGAITPSLHWEMFDDEGRAAVSLGASYTKQGGPAAQVVELQYYASSGFYALITLYQMWSVNVGGQDCTLVWRGDLLSSAAVAAQHGPERRAAVSQFMKATKQSVQAFLKTAK